MSPREIKVCPISQRTVADFGGKLPTYVSCYYASAVSFLSAWIPEAKAPEFYKIYVDDVETSVGNKGIGEQVMGPGFKGRSGAYASVHVAALSKYLEGHIDGKVVFSQNLTVDKIKEIISAHSPVIMNTMLTHSGHVVLVCGFNDKGFLVMDPWGCAPKYLDQKPGPHLYDWDLVEKGMRAADGRMWGTYVEFN